MEKTPLILFIKTYKPDFERTQKLLQSIDLHNKENIPVIISVNDSDFEFFKERISGYKVIKDSDVYASDQKDGWRYQQIIKVHAYRLGICENYLCLDSDSEFIRDFYYSDFLYDDHTPYTIMHESKAFLETMENIGMDSDTMFFKEALRATRPFFGNKGKEWDYGPSPYLWSCKVWEHFIEVYLKEQGKTFESFFSEIDKITTPSECVIYGEYLLRSRLIDIYPIEGFFKVYHFEKQYNLEKKFYNIAKLKKNYLGVIFQSNWQIRKRKFLLF
ncbi:DUF6492 family protein [Chryseobacterium sp. JK1]|uniref:DUF6492 family protein n=1 Tax=Chryseobacterium sp. JK1 TaxID=874294 RepID=UPI003D69C073